MNINSGKKAPQRQNTEARQDLAEVVMGLHWTPAHRAAGAAPADLDALCALLDGQGQVLDVICPSHPRNTNGSIIHTGDSREGASAWDDERIIVFLEALPEEVRSLAFIVVSTAGRTFDTVHGAACHVSDHRSETEWLRVELTSLGRCTAHCIGSLRRQADGWRLAADPGAIDDTRMAELQSLVVDRKKATRQPGRES